MENFALKARTTVKRIAAVAATSVMMGATMFGAVAAADLSDYPAPFVKDGKWVGLIVVGANAAPADVIGATDIAATLAQQATSAAGGGTTTTVGGQSKDIVLGDPIGIAGSGGFDQEMDHGDVSSLKDDTITFQSASYDYREMVVWHSNVGNATNPGPRVATSLTSVGGVEDDYKDGIYLEAEKGSIGYYYVFDSTINVSTTTSADPLAITFLGRKIKVTSIDSSGTKFTARIGQEVFLNVGDTVTIEGKKVTLKNVGSATTNTPVIVDVDGTVETVTGTETVNGIEVSVSDTFYSDNLNERSGTLIIGKDAVETYNDGDKFIVQCGTAYKRAECKKENPDWVWDVDDLYTTSAAGNTLTGSNDATAGATFGVVNDFIANDFSDNPPAAGGKYDYPLGGYEVRFDKLTVPDTDYMTLTISFQATEDLSVAIGSGATAVAAILVESSEAEAIEAWDGTDYKKTNKIWVYSNTTLGLLNQTMIVYRNPTDGKAKLARGSTTTNGMWLNTSLANMTIGRITYGETKSTNVVIALQGHFLTADALNITLDVIDDQSYITGATDDVNIWLGHAAVGAFDSLGASLNSEEGTEIIYNPTATLAASGSNPLRVLLGTKDENHRTRYGIVIVDPKSNGASDRVKLKIPKDQVKAKVTIAGPETTVTTSGGAVSVNTVSGVPIAKLDSEVTDKTAYNLILVGGPCANDLARDIQGATAATCASGYTSGSAKIKLFENAFGGTKTALLVAGYAASDTRNAATVLKDYKSYADKLKGTEVAVASSAGVITVSAPTVAASA